MHILSLVGHRHISSSFSFYFFHFQQVTSTLTQILSPVTCVMLEMLTEKKSLFCASLVFIDSLKSGNFTQISHILCIMSQVLERRRLVNLNFN